MNMIMNIIYTSIHSINDDHSIIVIMTIHPEVTESVSEWHDCDCVFFEVPLSFIFMIPCRLSLWLPVTELVSYLTVMLLLVLLAMLMDTHGNFPSGMRQKLSSAGFGCSCKQNKIHSRCLEYNMHEFRVYHSNSDPCCLYSDTSWWQSPPQSPPGVWFVIT